MRWMLTMALLAGCSGGGSDPVVAPDATDTADVTVAPDTADVTVADTPAGEPDTATEPAYGVPCEDAKRVGKVELGHFGFYASAAAGISDGVIPLTVLQPILTEGPCVLLKKENPFCDPPCGAGNLCDHGGTCVPYPANGSVGPITLTGLTVPLTMELKGSDYFETDVPLPLFEPGAHITATAPGDALPGFALGAYGVPDLVVPETVLVAKKGAPLAVTWTGEPGPQHVVLQLNVDQHGNSPATLRCDVPDTGSFEIPASLVTKLLEAGVSGFATLDMTRRTVDSASVPAGCVELRVLSYVLGKLTVEGHVACAKDGDCPAGKKCMVATNTCTP